MYRPLYSIAPLEFDRNLQPWHIVNVIFILVVLNSDRSITLQINMNRRVKKSLPTACESPCDNRAVLSAQLDISITKVTQNDNIFSTWTVSISIRSFLLS